MAFRLTCLSDSVQDINWAEVAVFRIQRLFSASADIQRLWPMDVSQKWLPVNSGSMHRFLAQAATNYHKPFGIEKSTLCRFRTDSYISQGLPIFALMIDFILNSEPDWKRRGRVATTSEKWKKHFIISEGGCFADLQALLTLPGTGPSGWRMHSRHRGGQGETTQPQKEEKCPWTRYRGNPKNFDWYKTSVLKNKSYAYCFFK